MLSLPAYSEENQFYDTRRRNQHNSPLLLLCNSRSSSSIEFLMSLFRPLECAEDYINFPSRRNHANNFSVMNMNGSLAIHRNEWQPNRVTSKFSMWKCVKVNGHLRSDFLFSLRCSTRCQFMSIIIMLYESDSFYSLTVDTHEWYWSERKTFIDGQSDNFESQLITTTEARKRQCEKLKENDSIKHQVPS